MIKVIDLKKVYKPKKGPEVVALNGVNLDFADSGLVFLLGKSGSGKSTLLNLLGGLDTYTSGDIVIKGKTTKDFKQSNFDSYRNTLIGFIFQDFNILEEYSVGKNIGLALELQHKQADKTAICEMLAKVDLEEYFDRKPNELSGGQKQRIAIARALIKSPEIIMADEPTGALDSNTGRQVFDTLKKLSENKLVIVVSHDRENAEMYADRIIELADGKVITDRIRSAETGELVVQPVMVVDEKLIRIKAGKTLQAEDIKVLNEALIKNTEDVFVSFDSKSNMEFSKKSAMLNKGHSTFMETTAESVTVKDYDPTQFKMTKSRLPVKDSFKMGASSLGHKKIRLIVSIFLSFLTFTMVGFCVSASLFESYKVEMQTAVDAKLGYFTVNSKQENDYGGFNNYVYDTAGITDEQIKKIEQITGKEAIRFYEDSQYYNAMITLSSNFENTKIESMSVYYAKEITNFLIVNSIDDVGLTAIGNSRLPKGSREIAITDYIADSFIEFGYKFDRQSEKITTPEQLIGKQLDNGFVITGVYKTPIDKSQFYSFKEIMRTNMLSGMTFSSADILMGMAFVGPKFSVRSNDKFEGYYPLQIGNATLSSEFTDITPDLGAIYTKGSGDTVLNGSGKEIELTGNKIALRMIDLSLFFGDIEPGFFNRPASQRTIKLSYTKGLEPISLEVVGYFEIMRHSQILFSEDMLGMFQNHDKMYQPANKSHGDFIGIQDNEQIKTERVNGYKSLSGCGQRESIYWGSTNGVASKQKVLADNEIIIPYALLSDLNLNSNNYPDMNELQSEIIEAYDALTSKDIYISYRVEYDTLGNMKMVGGTKYTIVGVWVTQDYSVVVSEKAFLAVRSIGSGVKKVLFSVPQNYGEQQELIKYLKSQRTRTERGDATNVLRIGTHISNLIEQAESMVSSFVMVFQYAAIALSIFAALLMMNFISTSISYKKKEIGVLRAIGARSSDVFKIFFAESSIIAMINTILASIALAIASILINNALKVSVLVFSPWSYLAMLGLSFFIAFIATILPTQKIARKKPIDAIHNK